jgi:hypothetical protein
VARRPPARIVDHIIDGGTWDANGRQGGGEWYVTEDGERLTPEEAFERRRVTAPTAESPSEVVLNAVGALHHYLLHNKVHPKSERALMEHAADWGAYHSLEGAAELSATSSTMQRVAGRMLAVEKIAKRPGWKPSTARKR